MMKRILAGLLAVLLLLTCVSCGKKEEKDPLAGLPTHNGEEIRGETPDTQDPTVEIPDNKEEKPADQQEKPQEDPKEEQKPEEQKPGNEEQPQEETKDEQKPDEQEKPEEQKPGNEDQPQQEQKPDSPYAGTALSFKTQTAKVVDSGSYGDIADLRIVASNGDHLYLLKTVNALERFNSQITDWNEANISHGNVGSTDPDEEEPDEGYEEEEIIPYSLQDEVGATYNVAFFNKKALLILPVSGTAGTVEAMTTEGTTVHIYMKKAQTGAGVLGEIATNFVVMELDAEALKSAKTYKLNYVS